MSQSRQNSGLVEVVVVCSPKISRVQRVFRLQTLRRWMTQALWMFMALWLLPAQANTQLLQEMTQPSALVGEGRFHVLFWDIYDAKLYAPEGGWRKDRPFALSLTYLRDFKGEDIAKRSVEEMRKQGLMDEETLNRWYQQMTSVFPDVNKNTTLVGIRDESGRTLFYRDHRLIGTIDEPRFADWFFGIWLNEQTSAPNFRKKLLGET